MRAGLLRHRVRFERRAFMTDGVGQVVQDPQTGVAGQQWVPIATVWAQIAPLSAREFIQAGAKQVEMVARITARHRRDVDAGMRAIHLQAGGRQTVYAIAGVLADPVSGLEYMTLPVAAGLVEDGQ